eukprot:1373352-Amorphochlora_amoeboformis.AAC.1
MPCFRRFEPDWLMCGLDSPGGRDILQASGGISSGASLNHSSNPGGCTWILNMKFVGTGRLQERGN